MRSTANEMRSTRALACRFRRPRRNHLRATPLDSVSEGVDRCTRGACAPHCANTDSQPDSIFIPQSRGPSDVLDHATSEIAIGSKLGIDATKKLPGEGFKRPWPLLIKMDADVKANVEKLFGLLS